MTSTTHKILITRELTEEQQALARDLELDVVSESALKIDYRNNWLSVQNELDETKKAVFVFTSQNGVKGFNQFKQAGISIPENVPVYAVGGKTAASLGEIGFNQVSVPKKQNGVGLAHLIIDDFLASTELKDASVLHFCGDKRRDELRHYLTDSDIKVKDIVVYKTTLNKMNLNEDESFDGILFYSPSAVQAFRQSGGFRNLSEGTELFAIGPTTAEELSIEAGSHVHISPQPDTEVFLRFVARVLGKRHEI